MLRINTASGRAKTQARRTVVEASVMPAAIGRHIRQRLSAAFSVTKWNEQADLQTAVAFGGSSARTNT
jgi:methylaspartate ammonia-lyase